MFYYSIHDENKYRDFVKKKIEIPDVVPNDIHRWMIKFNPVSFLTTNYDKLLETAAVKYCKTYKCIACDKEVASINGDRFILKVHGDIEHKNFVLKEEDYLRYEEHFKLTSTLMRSVFSTNTVVFIGYRIGDYNVKLIIDWVKHVLKDRFHPIFIRVEKEPLGKEELKYYESRGLEVVELSKIATAKEIKNYSSDDYTARYVDILKYLEAAGEMKKISNSDEESFLILYSRLKPLDKLNALRISDIQNSLSGCCIVDKGEIFLTKEQEGLFRRFLSIKRLSKDERKDISKSKWEKYRLISRVLNKARIYKVRVDDKITDIYDPLISYADQRCISIDYFGMESYCKNDYIEINAKSRKAFYLTRLHKYEEALGSFLEIAREAFGQKEYVHYYIAVINIIVLNKLLMNPMIKNYSGIKYDIDDGIITWDHEYELFDSMPQEFKREYQFLRDLGTSAVLFRYGYEASVDAKKLEDAISKHTIELGMTSSDKVIFNVNEYIHFLLGNGICLDVFTEYRSAVCNLMEKLVLKYVDQQKKELFSINPFGDTYNNIYFDQYDFYCFIRFFRANELVSCHKEDV